MGVERYAGQRPQGSHCWHPLMGLSSKGGATASRRLMQRLTMIAEGACSRAHTHGRTRHGLVYEISQALAATKLCLSAGVSLDCWSAGGKMVMQLAVELVAKMLVAVEDACLRAKYLGLQEDVWKASCFLNSRHQTAWRFENESEGAKIGGGERKRNCDAKRAPTIGPHTPGFHGRRRLQHDWQTKRKLAATNF